MTHAVKMEVMTPVHVGMGTEKSLIRGLDFDVNGRAFRVFDQGQLLKKLDKNSLSIVSSFLAQANYEDMRQYLTKKNVLDDISTLYESVSDFLGANEIRTTIRNGVGKCYIPGSSIKGAIRSVLAANLWNRRHGDLNETSVLGGINDSLLRFLQVTDCMLENQPMIFPVKIYSGDEQPRGNKFGSWKDNKIGGHTENFSSNKFVTFYEMLPDESSGKITSGEFRINWGTNAFVRQQNRIPNLQIFDNEKGIFWLIKIIQEHTNRFLNAELDFFDTFYNQDLDEDFFSDLNFLIAENKKSENSCLLRIGANVGWHSITGDWKYAGKHVQATDTNRHNRNIQYKTRKIGFHKDNYGMRFFLPGFIKLEIV